MGQQENWRSQDYGEEALILNGLMYRNCKSKVLQGKIWRSSSTGCYSHPNQYGIKTHLAWLNSEEGHYDFSLPPT